VLLTLRGVPFLYAGDELGLEDAVIPPERVVDPGGRDGCRAPIPWSADAGHGWAGEPWLPWPPGLAEHHADAQRTDEGSTLQLHRRLLAARRASAALRLGDLTVLEPHPDVLAYRRATADDARLVLVSYAHASVTVEVEGSWEVEVSSLDPAGGRPFTGELAAEEAVLLRPV
jgi:alpha-glucosidase